MLVAVCWPLNWVLPGARTSYLFFPLWLGYILIIDALVQRRTGNSLWSRSRKNFVLLFFISAPVWWLFELINLRTGNWEYTGRDLFSPLAVQPALHRLIFDRNSGRVRNGGVDAQL